MPLNKIAAVAAVGIATIALGAGVFAQDVVVDPAIAGMTPEQLVEARQEAMREDGGILRSAASLSGAEAVAAADTLIQNFVNFSAMFPEGSIVGDSKALPIIWEEKEAFDALFAQAAELSMQMKAAAEAGDSAGIAAAAQQIGPLCGMCHQKYRS